MYSTHHRSRAAPMSSPETGVNLIQDGTGAKTLKNKKGSRDKISRPLELYGRDGVIRTLDP